jgi:predicted RNase H-like HicB family nuclease
VTKEYTFQIVIEKEPEGAGYAGYSPTLPGCFRRGSTVEELKQSLRRAVRERLESLLARGEPVPQANSLLHVEELTVSIATEMSSEVRRNAY